MKKGEKVKETPSFLLSPFEVEDEMRERKEGVRESEWVGECCTLEPLNKTCFCAAKFYKFRRRPSPSKAAAAEEGRMIK